MGWIGQQDSLHCLLDGNNYLPMIHVRDLANIVHKIIEEPPATEEDGDMTNGAGQYIFAVDESQVTLLDIVKAISQEFLNTGKVHHLNHNECLLHENADFLMIDLKLQLGIVEGFNEIQWHSKEGIIEKIKDIRKEYERKRNLSPLKLCILGAPASGKTLFASYLAKKYKIAHIKIADVIREFQEQVGPKQLMISFMNFSSKLCSIESFNKSNKKNRKGKN